MSGSKRDSYNVAVEMPDAFFAIIALVGGIPFVKQRGWEAPAMDKSQSREDAWQTARSSRTGPLALCESSAPVELIVYSDDQCTFCAYWSREKLPALVDRVEDSQLARDRLA